MEGSGCVVSNQDDANSLVSICFSGGGSNTSEKIWENHGNPFNSRVQLNLRGGFKHVFFHFIYGMSSFPLTFTPSFFRGVGLNHQPAVNPSNGRGRSVQPRWKTSWFPGNIIKFRVYSFIYLVEYEETCFFFMLEFSPYLNIFGVVHVEVSNPWGYPQFSSIDCWDVPWNKAASEWDPPWRHGQPPWPP